MNDDLKLYLRVQHGYFSRGSFLQLQAFCLVIYN